MHPIQFGLHFKRVEQIGFNPDTDEFAARVTFRSMNQSEVFQKLHDLFRAQGFALLQVGI